jgi:hypothetical protein
MSGFGWDPLSYFMSMGLSPIEAARMAGAPPGAAARMGGQDGGFAPPGLMDAFWSEPEKAESEEDRRKKANKGAEYGMNIMQQAQPKAPEMSLPPAEPYRPNYYSGYRQFQPIKLQGLL